MNKVSCIPSGALTLALRSPHGVTTGSPTRSAPAATSRAEAEAESLRLTEEVAQLRGAVQTERDELAAARADLATMNERLASAEGIAKRLEEERADLDRREAAPREIRAHGVGQVTCVAVAARGGGRGNTRNHRGQRRRRQLRVQLA